MSRPKTPASVLELKGAFRKNPKRGEARAREPQAEGELRAPEVWLNSDYPQYVELLGIWRETAAVCWWLTAAEAAPLESYCRMKRLERHGIAKGPDISALLRLYVILGMTQDGRGKFTDIDERKRPESRGGKVKGSDWEKMRDESQRLRAV
jgi:hypothetical protein